MIKVEFNNDHTIECTWDYSPMRKNTFSKITTDKIEGRDLSLLESKIRKERNLGFGERIKLTRKEKYRKVEHVYKTLFKKGDKYESKAGINIFVGDNGCGKSSLLKFVMKQVPKKTILVDMETANPTISKPQPAKGSTYNMQEINNLFMWGAESHGETREGVLASILTLDFDFLILDEPEQGLSLKNQRKYFNKLKDMNKDMIIITHSKVFIEEADEVFDVETMKWIKSNEYLKLI